NIRIENRGSIGADILYQITEHADATIDLTVSVKNRLVESGYGQSTKLDYQLDPYNRIVQAGSNEIKRAVYSGEIQSIRNNDIEEQRDYDDEGRLEQQRVRYHGATLYSARYAYDGLGRIRELNESVLSESQSWVY